MELRHSPNKKPLSTTTANAPLERKCLEKGIRITYARRVILAVLAQSNQHLTVKAIYRIILSTEGETPLPVSTIYSNIRGLADAGIVGRRQLQSKHTYYSVIHTENYDRLVDVETGHVTELHNKTLDKLKADIAQEYGFNLTNCRIEFYGHSLNNSTSAIPRTGSTPS